MLDFSEPTTQLAAGGTIVALGAAVVLLHSPNSAWVRWLKRKNYQYEVTFSLYMLTPTEIFIFNSILFLTLSLLALACVVYLPDHIVTITNRAYYYFAGESEILRAAAAGSVKDAVTAAPSAWATDSTGKVLKSAATGIGKAAASVSERVVKQSS